VCGGGHIQVKERDGDLRNYVRTIDSTAAIRTKVLATNPQHVQVEPMSWMLKSCANECVWPCVQQQQHIAPQGSRSCSMTCAYGWGNGSDTHRSHLLENMSLRVRVRVRG
jgi:hypothetical protein